MAISAATLKVDVIANTSKAEQGVKSFGDKLNNAAKTMRSVGTGMTAALTLPLLGIAAASLKSAAEFEQNMNILQQVVDASASGMEAMQAQALSLGATTVFSAGEAAEAMVELGKAGMNTEQIMAAIGGVLSLAAAGGVSLAEAANLTAAALNAFGLEASEANRVADLFAATANASSADINDLGAGMRAAGFAFNLASQPIENLAASLAILTNVGLTGSDAGTALKNAFMRMMNPTAEATALMQELGIAFYDASGNMKALPAIIEMLNVATAGLTNEQRDAALATIFLSDGMKAMIPLMDAGATGFNAMVTEVSKTGAATDAAAARMKGLSGGIEYLKGSVDSFLIGAALPFLDSITNILIKVADAVTAFGALPPSVLNTALAFGAVLAVTGPLLVAIGLIAPGLAALAPAFAALAGPIGIAIAATVALAAAWTANIGGIQEITASAFAGVKEIFSTTASAAQQAANGIRAAFSNTSFPSLQELWADFQAGDFETIAEKIKTTAYELMVNLDAELKITAQAQSLKSALDQRADEIDAFGLNMVQGLTDSINNIDWSQAGINTANMISGWAEKINSIDWSNIGTSLSGNLKSAIDGAFVNFNAGGSEVGNKFDQAFRDAMAAIDWSGIWTATANLETSIRQGFADLVGNIGWGGLWTAAGDLEGRIRQGFATIMTNAFGSLDGTLGSLGATLSSTFSTMGSELSSSLSSLGSDISISVSNMASSVRTTVSTVFTSLAGQFTTSIGSMLSTATASIISTFASIGDVLSSAISGWLGGTQVPVDPAFPDSLSPQKSGAKGRQSLRPPTGAPDIPPIDWATYIPELQWNTYLNPLLWPTYVPMMEWSAFVPSLSWDNFVASIEWPAFVPALAWNSFISSIEWGSFIPDINWSSFISDVSWSNYIPGMAWSTYVPFLNWADFVPSFAAPASNSAPSNGVSAASFGGARVSGLARTSAYGVSAAGVGSNGITVNVTANVANDMDVEQMALRVAQSIQRRMRG